MEEHLPVKQNGVGSIPAIPVILELRSVGGRLSYTQLMQVRFLQLRSSFSGAKEAQLFRNQQAVGSNPTGSFYAGIVQGPVRVICNHLISVRIRVSASRVGGTEYHFSLIH